MFYEEQRTQKGRNGEIKKDRQEGVNEGKREGGKEGKKEGGTGRKRESRLREESVKQEKKALKI